MQTITQNLSGFRDYYQRRAEAACRANVENQTANFHQKAQSLAGQVGTVLSPDLPARGRCTAITSLLSWAVSRGSATVLLTDGVETCERNPKPIKLPEHHRLFMVLLPSRGSMRETASRVSDVKGQWERLIPGVQVIVPSDLGASFWGDTAALPR